MASIGFFVFGVSMFVLGVTGLSFIRRKKFYRRNLFNVEEFAGYGKTTARSREARIEAVARWFVVFGAVIAIAAYVKFW